METSNLGIICENCGSRKIVPLLYGAADEEMLILEWQEKIGLGGCFVSGVGSYLWACSDCGEPIKDERFLLQTTETSTSRIYRQRLERAFTEYRPVDELERSALRGKWILKSAIRCNFKSNTRKLILRRLPDGFDLSATSSELLRQQTAGNYGAGLFDDMYSFISQKSPPYRLPSQVELTVRVDREECDFLVSNEEDPDGADPIIVIRRLRRPLPKDG